MVNFGCAWSRLEPRLTAAATVNAHQLRLKLLFCNASNSTLYLWERWDVGEATPYIYYAGSRTALVLLAMRRCPEGVLPSIEPGAYAVELAPGAKRLKEYAILTPIHEVTAFDSFYHPNEDRPPTEYDNPVTYDVDTLIVMWGYWDKQVVRRLDGQLPPSSQLPRLIPLRQGESIATNKLSPSDITLGIGRSVVSRSGQLGDFLVLDDFEEFATDKLTLPEPLQLIVDSPQRAAYHP